MQFRFKEYCLDVACRELRRGTDLVPIEPQVFDILEFLVNNRERVVTKDDLLAAIWGGRVVSESALTSRINAVRKAVGDSGDQQSLVRTIPRKGIRFVGEVTEFATTGERLLARPDPAPALPLPDRSSIAVLPFQNLSGDPEQDYFADGIVEDITTALSRFQSLFVIARNSSFTYKHKAIDIKQVGRELGVRYVLEGSVRKAADRVRITGQLIEASTSRHLWADKFDGALEDVFGLQDQVTMSVVGLIVPKLEQAEIERAKKKPTASLDSYDLYLRGTELVNARTLDRLPEALQLFKDAFGRDPSFAAAYAMAARTILIRQSFSGVPLTTEMRAEAIRFADLGSRTENDAFALAISGHVLTYLGHEYDRGALLLEQAVDLNPNLAAAWHFRGWVSLMCCEHERAIESFERMIRLSPLDPQRARAWGGCAFALFGLGRYEEGFASAKKAKQLEADAQVIGAFVVNAIRAGHTAEAREAVAQLLKSYPEFRSSYVQEAFPIRSQETKDRISIALRDAGLPN